MRIGACRHRRTNGPVGRRGNRRGGRHAWRVVRLPRWPRRRRPGAAALRHHGGPRRRIAMAVIDFTHASTVRGHAAALLAQARLRLGARHHRPFGQESRKRWPRAATLHRRGPGRQFLARREPRAGPGHSGLAPPCRGTNPTTPKSSKCTTGRKVDAPSGTALAHGPRRGRRASHAVFGDVAITGRDGHTGARAPPVRHRVRRLARRPDRRRTHAGIRRRPTSRFPSPTAPSTAAPLPAAPCAPRLWTAGRSPGPLQHDGRARHGDFSVNFASDNTAPASPEILAALQACQFQGVVKSYGADPITARVRARMNEVFGREVTGLPGGHRHRRQRAWPWPRSFGPTAR